MSNTFQHSSVVLGGALINCMCIWIKKENMKIGFSLKYNGLPCSKTLYLVKLKFFYYFLVLLGGMDALVVCITKMYVNAITVVKNVAP